MQAGADARARNQQGVAFQFYFSQTPAHLQNDELKAQFRELDKWLQGTARHALRAAVTLIKPPVQAVFLRQRWLFRVAGRFGLRLTAFADVFGVTVAHFHLGLFFVLRFIFRAFGQHFFDGLPLLFSFGTLVLAAVRRSRAFSGSFR